MNPGLKAARLLQRLSYDHRFIKKQVLALEKKSFTIENKIDWSRSLNFGDFKGLTGFRQTFLVSFSIKKAKGSSVRRAHLPSPLLL